MNYQQTANEIDRIDERIEEINYKLDELEEEMEKVCKGSEYYYILDDQREELLSELDELEQEKAELMTSSFTAWDNGF